MDDPLRLNVHEDAALFREAVNFTASRTGFGARLIEKDYFCTVLLAYLTLRGGDQFVFKGGTCLAKVHAGFYRLSEDLDLAIPMPVDASRRSRRTAVLPIKRVVADVVNHDPAFTADKPLKGANNSTQYNGAIRYDSPTTGQRENILVEVSVREPLVMAPVRRKAETVLLDPIGGEAFVPGVDVNCIALEEAIAEKFRAALTRQEVAIRDFYDVHYVVTQRNMDPFAVPVIEMVRQKLSVPGNPPVDVSRERLADLERQRNTRLRTVLRDREFRAFDLDQAIHMVVTMAERLG
jgi:predicted nucleotidyltransferase component of viral defense system